jgi:hypothetical protein
MAYKSRRTRTGTNSYTTKTHSRGKGGGYRMTYTSKSPDGTTRSTSYKNGVTTRRRTRKVGGGYTQRTTYTVSNSNKTKYKHNTNNSGDLGILGLFIVLLCKPFEIIWWLLTLPFVVLGNIISAIFMLLLIFIKWCVIIGIVFGIIKLIELFT